jgi:hypothetical protein
MRDRSAEGQVKKDETNGADAERRNGGQRVSFEALVAVGELQGDGGFEAESVDVSLDGMRLRTAYLPKIGEKLLCRFDGVGAEIIAECEVIWAREEAKGGEFGLRFVDLDPEAAEAVRAMCATMDEPDKVEEPQAPNMPKGSRVRLHIEGLGSPMKARVRDAAGKQIEVGSNLEFLKVGRTLELEDVEAGGRREALVDHVKVDVDPATNVPQLVVTLRFGAADDKDVAANAAPASRTNEPAKSERSERNDNKADKKSDRANVASKSAAKPAQAKAARDDDEPSDGDEANDKADEGVGAKAARAGRALTGKVAPAMAGVAALGARAKGAFSGLFQNLQKRREERATTKAPKKVTSPPPGGALHSEGKRLVRDDMDDEQPVTPPKSRRKAALMGSMVGLIAVLAVFGVSKALSHGGSSEHVATAPTSDEMTHPAPLAANNNNAPAGAMTVNVPLFGATPMSTTEPVPQPSAVPSALASAAPSATPADQQGGDEDAPKSDGKISKEWGEASLSHPTVLKLKMDGPVEGITGSAGAAGFTVTVPNHRSISTASELAKKDKRLASVNVVNTSHGAEITVQFKDDVPPYAAKVKGDRIEIAIGKEGKGHEKVAKKKSSKKKHR